MIDMNLEQTDEKRPMDFNVAIGYDKNTIGSIIEQYDSVDMRNFHKSAPNITGGNSNDDATETVMVKKELRNAMHGLQIVSEEQLQNPPNALIYRGDLSREKNKKLDNDKTTLMENILTEGIAPVMKHMNYKAMKSLKTQLNSATTTSSSSLLKLKSRSDISINQSTSKNVIKTISNTANGIHLKEEKINFFGIPVTTNHKKRTEVKPFNFQSRTKERQQLQKSNTFTAPCKSKFSSNNATSKIKINPKPSLNNAKINETNKTSSRAVVSQQTVRKINEASSSFVKSFSHKNIILRKPKLEITEKIIKTNKENDIPNNNTVRSREIKSKCTMVHPKADKTHQFTVKMKKRELEMKEMRANIERKKKDKEKF